MATKRTVEKIELKNFKAFRQAQTIDFKNKHVLIYGHNGSGKSSIFWGLYTFLQSSIKDKSRTDRYFEVFNEQESNTHQSLRNIFESEVEDAYIELTINDGGNKIPYRISKTMVNTNLDSDTTIKLLNTTSDFINYKLLSGFYRDSHKYDVNLWGIFERDIFPFITDDIAGKTFLDKIIEKTSDVQRYGRTQHKVRKGWRKDNYLVALEAFNVEIDNLLGEIQQYANDFIKEHFYHDRDVLQVQLKFDKRFDFDLVAKHIWADNQKHIRENELRIKLIVNQWHEAETKWIPIQRVQSFLNEAQLTRIALGIRIGALRKRLQTNSFKLLVLDDMLISLDLSNRMEVIKIILNYQNKRSLKFFDSFQKIILTHDKGFYNILKNYTNDNQWEYYKLTKDENSNEAPKLTPDITHIERASRFLADGEYDAVGNALRKAVENIIKKYLNQGLNSENEEFTELSKMLKAAYEKYTLNERRAFNKVFVDKDIPLATIKKLETDFENDNTLTEDEKQKLRILKRELYRYLYKQYEVIEEKDKLFDELRVILDRIMNPSSHASGEAMYESELANAITKVHQLKQCLEQSNT